MWLSLILLFLIAGITIRQAMQGLFSALIMVVLTICCAAAALGTYEWVAIHLVAKYWKPNYAMPVALGLIFGLPLSLLHTLFGQLVKRASLVPAWADRIGGGACGFVTAMTMVGILALCLQMLPFDRGSILGYARIYVPDPLEPVDPKALGSDEETELFLKPDRFVLAVASVLSVGTFSTEHSFFEHNPNLVQTVAWVGATHPGVSRYAPPGSISVRKTAPIPFVYKKTPANERRDIPGSYEPEPAAAGHDFRMVRVGLRDDARDAQKSHLFTLRQFRLVGRQRGEQTNQQYHPIAIRLDDSSDDTDRHIRFVKRAGTFVPAVNGIYSPGRQGNQVDIVFELPSGFTPSFLEYKRGARVRVSFADSGPSETGASASPPPQSVRTASAAPPAAAPPAEPSASAVRGSRGSRGNRAGRGRQDSGRAGRRGGRIRGVEAKEDGSKFSEDLPLTLQSYQRLQNVDISRGKMANGHLLAVVDEQSDGPGPVVSKFLVPDGKRLLQLHSTRLQAGSFLGKAISFAATTVQNYFVQDAQGRQYKMVGKYAIASVSGKKIFEVQYYSSPTGSIGGIGKFNRINEKKLTPKDEFVLLFLVDPGARITSFSTGGSATRRDDLTLENLVAPD